MIALRNYCRYGGPDLTTDEIGTDVTLYTPIYISLFGGNIEADTAEKRQPAGVQNMDWWGNLFQDADAETRYNSRFERMLLQTALNSAGLRDLEKAVNDDLNWLIEANIIRLIGSEFELISANKLGVTITATKPGNIEERYQYLWERP